MDPLGFSLENFDALARERQTESIFDQGGRKLTERPIRTDSIPNIIAGGFGGAFRVGSEVDEEIVSDRSQFQRNAAANASGCAGDQGYGIHETSLKPAKPVRNDFLGHLFE